MTRARVKAASLLLESVYEATRVGVLNWEKSSGGDFSTSLPNGKTLIISATGGISVDDADGFPVFESLDTCYPIALDLYDLVTDSECDLEISNLLTFSHEMGDYILKKSKKKEIEEAE